METYQIKDFWKAIILYQVKCTFRIGAGAGTLFKYDTMYNFLCQQLYSNYSALFVEHSETCQSSTYI